MKHTIFRYLNIYGDYTFQEKPFSPEDALALTILSYLKMNKIVEEFGRKEPLPITVLAASAEKDSMFADPVYGKYHRKTFDLMVQSRRFRNIKVQYYVEWTDGNYEVQFSAVTFLLGEHSIFITFRGTDETLNGWKEDFNMGFLPSIPSQRRALIYLKRVAELTKGNIITAGHSKGGNLALYASCHAPVYVQRRIRRIYNFDGPGIKASCRKLSGYQRIRHKYCKIVPKESVIGMIFQSDSNYHVVRSYRHGVLQHDILQWMIEGDRLVYVTGLRKKYLYLSHVLNYWIHSLTTEQIAAFVETLYQLVCASHVKTVYELIKRPLYARYTFYKEFFHLSSKQKKNFIYVIRKLFLAPFNMK